MSTKHSPSQKRTDPRDAYIQIGVDNENCHHLYRTKDETVLVVRDGKLTYRYDLLEKGKTVNDWIRYVRQKRGWKFRDLHIDMADFAADRIRR